ncbi:hypothetical protein DRE_03480 [Drechslerella stenobrocha 248]|uniref:Uncharacterized protein n=1 Tax=Drechslerella stenobrocha 248 TaxID=1043628 RepID=W7HSS2_9PEZI|nr:hypothetical protein DRE_03480 [Drechslerella stenobrocha 248]
MSVAYNPNPAPANGGNSFSGSHAFSFDVHDQTQQLFGPNPDPQTQVPNQAGPSLPIPTIQVNQPQVAVSSDYDMVNYDVDLDYDDGGEMNLDLATPTATAEDDLMAEAGSSIAGPAGPFLGVGTQVMSDGIITDAEMGDDSLAINEAMPDAYQPAPAPVPGFTYPGIHQPAQPLEQPLEQRVDQALQSLAALIENTSPAKSREGGLGSRPQSASEVHPAQGAGPVEPQLQAAERPVEATALPAEQLMEPPAVPQQSPPAEVPRTPVAAKPEPRKLETPSSPIDNVRISQADTVALENPTPEVGQREWLLAETAPVEGHEALHDSPSLQALQALQGHQEIPTSPLHAPSDGSPRPSVPSEHGAKSPKSSPPSENASSDGAQTPTPTQPQAAASQETVTESVEEGQHSIESEDPLLTHPVVVVYRGLEFSLFPVLAGHAELPDTPFLPDRSHIGSPLSKLVTSLRDVLGDQFTSSEEIVLNFTSLGVEFEEENVQMNHFTLYDILGLFAKLVMQDGVSDIQPLHISLSSRKKYIPKLEQIHDHILGGGGLASWKQLLAGPTGSQLNTSEPHRTEAISSHDDNYQAPEQENHATHSPKIPSKAEEVLETDDEQLELQESEKDYDGGELHYPTNTQEGEEHLDGDLLLGVDVPKSPSQASFVRPNTSHSVDHSQSEGLKVPETQYSQEIRSHPANKVEPTPPKDADVQNSSLSKDESSFVTAREKQQDASVLQSDSGSRGYGLLSDEDEPEQSESGKGIEIHGEHTSKHANSTTLDTYDGDLFDPLDDDPLNFDEDHEHAGQLVDNEEEDSRSSSTIQEGPENVPEDDAAPGGDEGDEGDEAADGKRNWNDWTYDEGDHDEDEEYHGPGQDAEKDDEYAAIGNPDDAPGLVDLEEATTDNFDPSEFAYFPQPFSPLGEQDGFGDDEPLLGLDQHETLSTTASAKRAREDDEEEEALSEPEEANIPPVPASKRHKQL